MLENPAPLPVPPLPVPSGEESHSATPPPLPPEPPSDIVTNDGLLRAPFSFSGRISRMEFALSHVILAVVLLANAVLSACAFSLSELFDVDASVSAILQDAPFYASLAVMAWMLNAQAVKRCHDCGISAWCVLIPVFCPVWLFFARSTRRDNRHGAPANIHIADVFERIYYRKSRRRAVVSAFLWFVFSPAFLFMARRWRLLDTVKRMLLFLCSPLVVFGALFLFHQMESWKMSEQREEVVMQCLSAKHLGVNIEFENHVLDPDAASDTYRCTLKAPLTESQCEELEGLSLVDESGWTYEEKQTPVEDYGYYEEDYGERNAADTEEKVREYRLYKEVATSFGRVSYSLELTGGSKDAILRVEKR